MTARSDAHRVPSFRIDGALQRDAMGSILARIVSEALPGYLPGRRWFGHKQRQIVGVDLVDWLAEGAASELFVLAIVRLRFGDGNDVDYFVPLAFSVTVSETTAHIATVDAENGRWFAVDAPALPSFRSWLLSELRRASSSSSHHGVFAWSRTDALTERSETNVRVESRLMSAEQSNTSVVYGDSIILKLFRRVDCGINPDVELGRFLTTRTDFRNMPLLLGDLRYVDHSGAISSLAVAQSFVKSIGDGWSYTLDALDRLSTQQTDPVKSFVADARRLGQRTAELHLALARGSSDPDIQPELISGEDVSAWADTVNTSISRVGAALATATPAMGKELVELTAMFQDAREGFRTRLAGFDLLISRAKTRVHGDYHLGQTLRTPDDDFVILDLEGEPRRSIAERRAKTSPLKDVAGMLRSFSYARGTAERAAVVTRPAHVPDLIAWERAVRQAFLDAYFDDALAGGAAFLPSTREDFREALAPWELDKALYEVEYEMNNRPDWLWLPLTATLKLV